MSCLFAMPTSYDRALMMSRERNGEGVRVRVLRRIMADVLTIGAYGWSEATFFAALQSAGVRTFCDIRRRRGVRGHEYAFANAGRLQARLTELGIAYVHRLDLAPSDALRQAQARADAKDHTARRSRTELTAEFAAAFENEVLTGFDPAAFLAGFAEAGPVVLFCVERDPQACHRGWSPRGSPRPARPSRT
jgi:uncharacterized protein (DUF488 family)